MFNREPAAVSGAIAELVRQTMFLLLAFEIVKWTDPQQAIVLSFTSAALAVGSVLFTRSNSVSFPMADKQIEIAKASSVERPTDQIIQQAKDSL